jgi:valyl-tRNA synthetase
VTLDKTYNAAETEAKHYQRWEQSGAFAADPASAKTPFCIMMPPPNVTGNLHMGHALTFTLQDILIRYQRMNGRDTLWQPGTDHAGIATQMVVERELGKEKTSRQELGRQKFLERVWEWKAHSGGAITQQLRRLGASPDWGRERFTMDAALNRAVNKVFVQLYQEGLIYKDKRLVNWDPKLQTAISDLEVEQREVKGQLWHLRYPLENGDGFITIATTRPETMLGDTAVAVHPQDERYQNLIGQHVILPLVGRRIPIIADEHADPTKGSGAVKITPAHDFNDFAVGKRNALPMIIMMDKFAHIVSEDWVPPSLRGLERSQARKQILTELEALGLIETIEPNLHRVPHGDRSGVVIEPFLSEQWYVKAEILAQPALQAVQDGRTRFVPAGWENTYYAWLKDIEPWCISRQLWWGHQIPAWYGIGRDHGDNTPHVFVAETEAEAILQAQAKFGTKILVAEDAATAATLLQQESMPNGVLWRDSDVLDTWFSSALWPFSTLGWPEQTPELKRYYPSDVLVTGFDIIFFWVARMMMMGLHFMGDVPFRTVYIHALVRDEKGQKMSKSKGNVIDPLDMIAHYGCDALRFALTALSTPGRDVKLSPARIEGYRNFSTKLWNAARFCQMNGCRFDENFRPDQAQHALNQWLVARINHALESLQRHYAELRFDLVAQTLHHCVWHDFCDWFLEFAKPALQTEGHAEQAETQATAAWALRSLLKLLHPVMPFITEELWEEVALGQGQLMLQPWPEKTMAAQSHEAAAAATAWLINLITAIRSVRNELNVPAATLITLQVASTHADKLKTHVAVLQRLARVQKIEAITQQPQQAAQIVLEDMTLYLPLANIIDLAQERARLAKEVEKLQQETARLQGKLANAEFIQRAPAELVEEQRQKLAEYEALHTRLIAAQGALAE